MFEMHAHGLDVLAGVEGAPATPMHVQATNVPIYPVNMMAGDTPPSDLGEPAAVLQLGDLVEAVGPSVQNPKGAPFTPVQVRGRDGLYWVRSTSVAENAPLRLVQRPGAPETRQPPPAPMAWWKYAALALLGVGAIGVVAASASDHGASR